MLKLLSKNFRRLCSHLRWPTRYLSRRKVIIKRFGRSNPKAQNVAKTDFNNSGSAMVHPNNQLDNSKPKNSIRIATFNAASLFSMAPATPKDENFLSFGDENGDILNYKRYLEVNSRAKSVNDRPKSILKQSHLHSNSMNDTENLSKQQKFAKSKLRVSINLPDNEISLLRNQKSNFAKAEKEGSSSGTISKILRGKGPLKSSLSFSTSIGNRSSRTVVEILRELDAGILALQDVKAVEENGMKPLSDLASALGMDYVFAESWAPEYGNTVLSKWPIKRWKVQKIFDDTDFRNVLKVTIDVPQAGEINVYCTHLDHLDDNWRMKQIDAIMQSNNEPHILAGVLNVLDETDYSGERWADIVKYYEEMGKPTPKVEMMRNLKSKQYTDAKDFAGECESVVMIAKGQSVQGTCKYGTRVDYILSSPNSPYKFVPGSYSVLSSKGTSDHHIVKVDITKVNISAAQENATTKRRQPKHKVVKITQSSLSRCIWKTDRRDR
ncbi:Endonuclease/exonuclease/phosphatase protein [Quillaja saponaria]|uniref:Endonuclease/exonuclease/phosphatase protein n=1 Tax=Quillaja saponaria TaxID=32244 RepID=A0AAD7Q9L4_QUISA|nr:Endonuclease/exonuclease/phosphatase protein [Quillaja saponaria]